MSARDVGRVEPSVARMAWVVVLATFALLLALWPGSPLGLWPGTLIAGVVGLGAAITGAWPDLAPQLRPGARALFAGVLGGLAMALMTHALYPLAVGLIPSVADEAAMLYARLESPPGMPAALPIVLLVVLMEELVWRGVAYTWLRRRVGAARAVAVATLLYAVPQLASGSWLLPVLAIGCGAVWTLQRAVSGGLVVPFLTHLVWDLLVMKAFPLQG